MGFLSAAVGGLAAGIGGSLLGGGDDGGSSAKQEMKAGSYPKSGVEIWDQYVDYYLGDSPKLKSLYTEQDDQLYGQGQKVYDLLKGTQGDVLDQLQFGYDNPKTINLGGGQFQIAPMGGVNMAKQMGQAQLAPETAKLEFLQKHPVNQGELKYLDQLSDLAQKIQSWRYQVPTTTQKYQPGLLETLGGMTGVAGAGMDIYGKGKDLGWWGNSSPQQGIVNDDSGYGILPSNIGPM